MEKQNLDRHSKPNYHIVHFYTMCICSAYLNTNTGTSNRIVNMLLINILMLQTSVMN